RQCDGRETSCSSYNCGSWQGVSFNDPQVVEAKAVFRSVCAGDFPADKRFFLTYTYALSWHIAAMSPLPRSFPCSRNSLFVLWSLAFLPPACLRMPLLGHNPSRWSPLLNIPLWMQSAMASSKVWQIPVIPKRRA